MCETTISSSGAKREMNVRISGAIVAGRTDKRDRLHLLQPDPIDGHDCFLEFRVWRRQRCRHPASQARKGRRPDVASTALRIGVGRDDVHAEDDVRLLRAASTAGNCGGTTSTACIIWAAAKCDAKANGRPSCRDLGAEQARARGSRSGHRALAQARREPSARLRLAK